MNQIKYNIYRIPKTTPLLITLVDGSGSMWREYPRIVEMYQAVFGDFNDYYRLEYQWTQDLYSLLPFQQAGSGNITKTLSKLFQSMLAQEFPKKITIIFISDGREVFELKELEELIKKVQNSYQIQFVCIAISNQFSDQINEMFTKYNNYNQPYFYSISRSSRKTYNMINQDFFEAFNNIKKLLPEVSKYLHVSDTVKQTITSPQAVDIVLPGNVYLAEREKNIKIQEQILPPSNDSADLLEIITKSMKQLLEQAQGNSTSALKEFSQIYQISQELLEEMISERKEDKNYEQISLLLNISNLIAEGSLDLQSFNEFQYQNLKQALEANNLDKIHKIITLLTNKGSDEQKMTAQIINLISSLEFKELKMHSIKKSSEDLQGEIIQSCFVIVKDALKRYKLLFEETPCTDFVESLKAFKDVIFKALASVFEFKTFKIKDASHLDILGILNQIIKTITELNGRTTLEEAIDLIRNLIIKEEGSQRIYDENDAGQGERSEAIFDSSDELKYLPKSVQLCLNNDLENAKPFLIFIYDKSDSIIVENNIAQRMVKQIFESTERIEMEWVDGQLILLDNQKYQNKQFNSLVEVFDELEADFQLSKCRILLSLITDGENKYNKLHKYIKVAKLSKYYIKMHYFALGVNFQSRIESDIQKKFQNQQVRGKPLLFPIPLKLKIKICNQKSQTINYTSEQVNSIQKAFQDFFTLFNSQKL